MPRILQAEKKVTIEALSYILFVFEFHSKRDQARAIGNGPWNFSKNLMVFKELTGWQNPMTMVFDDMTIWVQYHNIALAWMHEEILMKLGRNYGRYRILVILLVYERLPYFCYVCGELATLFGTVTMHRLIKRIILLEHG